MEPDIAIVAGVIAIALAFPALLSAFSESRTPRAAALLAVLGGGLVLYALSTRPGGYALEDIPQAFVRVAAMVVN